MFSFDFSAGFFVFRDERSAWFFLSMCWGLVLGECLEGLYDSVFCCWEIKQAIHVADMMISQLLNACFGLLLPEIIVCALCYERLLPPSFLPLALNRCGSVFPLDSLRNLALREMSISQQPNKWRQESVGCLHFQGDYYPVFLSLLLAGCSEVSAVTDERCQQQHCCYCPVCFLLS